MATLTSFTTTGKTALETLNLQFKAGPPVGFSAKQAGALQQAIATAFAACEIDKNAQHSKTYTVSASLSDSGTSCSIEIS